MRVINRECVSGRTFRRDAFTFGMELDLRSSDFAAIPIAREAVAGTESGADHLPMFHVKQ